MDSIVNTLNEFFLPLFGDNLILGYKIQSKALAMILADAVALKERWTYNS